MRNFDKSDYALNKFSEGIVYKFSNQIREITKEQYLRENPNKTEGDFLKLKEISEYSGRIEHPGRFELNTFVAYD